MKNLKSTVNLNSRTVFTFDGVKASDGGKSSTHPTTSGTSNSTYIFTCFK